jgi:metallophosphoesterase superfamily enzyme
MAVQTKYPIHKRAILKSLLLNKAMVLSMVHLSVTAEEARRGLLITTWEAEIWQGLSFM